MLVYENILVINNMTVETNCNSFDWVTFEWPDSPDELMEIEKHFGEPASDAEQQNPALSGESAFDGEERPEVGAEDLRAAQNRLQEFHNAIACNDENAILTWLDTCLDRDCSIDQLGINGYNALHLTISEGMSGLCAFFLQKGADPNALTAKGQSPLHLAIQRDQPHIFELLVQRGAKTDALSNGEDLYHYAKAFRNIKITGLLKSLPNFSSELYWRKTLVNVWAIVPVTVYDNSFYDLSGMYLTPLFNKIVKHAKKYVHSTRMRLTLRQFGLDNPEYILDVLSRAESNFQKPTDALCQDINKWISTVFLLDAERHVAGVVLCGNIAMFCDRGKWSANGSGVQIYAIQHGFPYAVFIEELKAARKFNQGSAFVTTYIENNPYLSQIVTKEFPRQKVGNCPMTSTMAVVHGLSLLHAWLKLPFKQSLDFADQLYTDWLYDFRAEILASYLNKSTNPDPDLTHKIRNKVTKLLRKSNAWKTESIAPAVTLLQDRRILI